MAQEKAPTYDQAGAEPTTREIPIPRKHYDSLAEDGRTLDSVLRADALKAPEQKRRCDMSGALASSVMVLQGVALEVQPLVSFRPMGS